MTKNNVIDWCNNLCESWRNVDFDRILDIFSDVESYYEDPFSKPGSTSDEIKAFWEEIKYQKIHELYLNPIAIDGNMVIIRWYLDYTDIRTGEKYVMDGIYHIEFNSNNKCTKFTQWWVMKE